MLGAPERERLPVMDKGQPVDLVSVGDLVKDVISEQKFIIEQIEHYLAGRRVGADRPARPKPRKLVGGPACTQGRPDEKHDLPFLPLRARRDGRAH